MIPFETITILQREGLRPPKTLTLAITGAVLAFANGVSLRAKFQSEVASTTTTYAATGTLRVMW